MPLTDIACRNAKAKDRPYKLSDGGGLYLLVGANGSKLWRLAYRFGGKQKLLSFGAYPEVPLAEVRERRAAAKKLLAEGVDPSQARKEQKRLALQRAGRTFEAVAREWHENMKSAWTAPYTDFVMRRLEVDLFPAMGRRPISEIDGPELLDVLRSVERRGAVYTAHRLSQLTGQIFRYAIAAGVARYNPAGDLRGALKKAPKVRNNPSLREAEVAELVWKIDDYDGSPQTRLALKLVLLTFVRTVEARFARWSEFEERPDGPIWRVPAERMKMGREHIVPLAPQTVAVLEQLKTISHGSPFVLPSPTKTGVVSENTMLFALYRMGYHSRLTVHGFRGTASTILNEHGFNRDWIELQLAHADDDSVRGAYNSAEYLPGRRDMMLWWANFIDSQARKRPGR